MSGIGMENNWKPRYSGEGNSGICVCGCIWKNHHLSMIMNPSYVEATKEGYLPEECVTFGSNEAGGMKFNEETGEWDEHCGGYKDRGLGE